MTDTAAARVDSGRGALPPDVVGRGAEAAARVGDFARGGSRELIRPPDDLRHSIAAKVQERLAYARKTKKEQARDSRIRLSTYDRILLVDDGQRGEDLVTKLQSGEPLSIADTALSWALVNDELVQKEGAVGRTYDVSSWQRGWNEGLRNFQQRIGWMPGTADTGLQGAINRFSQRVHRVMTSGLVMRMGGNTRTSEHGSTTPELTSDYIRQTRFTEMTPREAAEDIMELHRMKVRIEESLHIPNVNPDRWNQPDFRRGEGHPFLDSIADTQDAILRRLAAENDRFRVGDRPMTFAELQAESPGQAERVRHQAVQEGLLHFADGLARDLLTAERPKVDRDRIKLHADKIGKPAEGDERAELEEDKVEAQNAVREAKARLKQLNGTRSVDGSIAALRTARAIADTEYTTINSDLTTQITGPGGLEEQLLAATLPKDRDTIRAQIANLKAQILAAKVKRDKADKDLNDATSERTLLGEAASVNGSILNLKEKVKKIQTELDGTPDDGDKQKKSALLLWHDVLDPANYERILDTVFSQDEDGEYQHHILADANLDPSGQIIGAERLRQLILEESSPGKGYSTEEQKAIGRDMISDEAIARTIIKEFRVDLLQEIPNSGGDTYQALLKDVNTARNDLQQAQEQLRKHLLSVAGGATLDPAYAQAVRDARDVLHQEAQPLLRSLLPLLEGTSNFQRGKLISALMKQGGQDAKNGNPYMEVPAYYEQQRPERQLTSEAIAGNDKGTIIALTERGRFGGSEFVWDGELDELTGDFFKDLNIDDHTKFHFNVTTTLPGFGSRDQADCIVEVEVNEAFLASLPETPPPDWPRDFTRQFYDRNGIRLLTPLIATRRDGLLGERRGDWVALPLVRDGVGRLLQWDEFGLDIPASLTGSDILSRLNTLISPNTSGSISTALANEMVFHRRESPRTGTPAADAAAERRRIAQGFHPVVIDLPPKTLGGSAGQAVIRYDDVGQFSIQFLEEDGYFGVTAIEPITGAVLYGQDLGTQQLEAFYNQQTQELIEARGDPIRQRAIQERIQLIQERVGRELLRTQIRHQR